MERCKETEKCREGHKDAEVCGTEVQIWKCRGAVAAGAAGAEVQRYRGKEVQRFSGEEVLNC